MFKFGLKVIAIFFGYLICCCAQASHATRLEINPHTHNLQYFSPSNRELSIDNVAKMPASTWQTMPETMPYGLTTKDYWFKFSIDLTLLQHKNEPLFLEIRNQLIDELEIHIVNAKQRISFEAGDKKPMSKRPVTGNTLLFPLPLQTAAQTTIFIKYHDQAATALPLAVVSQNQVIASRTSDSVIMGLLIGIFAMLGIVSGAIYKIGCESKYLYFCSFVATLTLNLMLISGYAALYLWPSFMWMQDIIAPSLLSLTIWCAVQFTRHALHFNNTAPAKLNTVISWLALGLIMLTPIYMALPPFISILVSTTICIATVCLTFVLLVLMSIKKQIRQPVFIVSWLILIVSFVLTSLNLTGVAAWNYWIETPVLLGYALQAVLFGSVLFMQFYWQRNEKFTLQQEQIQLAQSAQQDQLLQLEVNHDEQLGLEALVDERTFELNVTLRELQETNRRLEEQSTNDALTGAKNRKFYNRRLVAEYRLSRRQLTPLSMLILDADHFKSVNDTYGHTAGDKALIAMSDISRNELKRPNDYVCRYGGEEFAILLSNTDHNGALKIAERIRAKIEKHVVVNETSRFSIQVSIGVATLIIDEHTPESKLFDLADKALYQAKKDGRNRVCSAPQPSSELPKEP
ncbi:MAG: GGDEF domain-containing protein [Psychrobium sp.]|nr:GGDEF domain-containing protein [Psychrobium sp.]